MLINDKSQLKRNVEQIGFQRALKTSKSLSSSDRLRQTVLYCHLILTKFGLVICVHGLSVKC